SEHNFVVDIQLTFLRGIKPVFLEQGPLSDQAITDGFDAFDAASIIAQYIIRGPGPIDHAPPNWLRLAAGVIATVTKPDTDGIAFAAKLRGKLVAFGDLRIDVFRPVCLDFRRACGERDPPLVCQVPQPFGQLGIRSAVVFIVIPNPFKDRAAGPVAWLSACHPVRVLNNRCRSSCNVDGTLEPIQCFYAFDRVTVFADAQRMPDNLI